MALNSCLAKYKWHDVQNFTASCKHLGLRIAIHFGKKKADLVSGKKHKENHFLQLSLWNDESKYRLHCTFVWEGISYPHKLNWCCGKAEEEGCLIVWSHLWISRHTWQRTAFLPTDRSCSRVLILVMICVCVE